jgi:ribonuclease HI
MTSEEEVTVTPGPDSAEVVEVWTDGGCKPNPGPGGWAAILRFRGAEKEMSGAEPATTNNRMELTAAAAALHKIEWRWVRGHAGDVMNERADALATAAREGRT